MKTLIILTTLLLSFSTWAKTCRSAEDAVTKKIFQELPKVINGSKLPGLVRTYSYISDHLDQIKSSTILRGRSFHEDMLFKIKFKDGSDVQINFQAHELGKRTMRNIFLTINTVTRSNKSEITLSNDTLARMFRTRTLGNLTVNYDYFGEETEIGSKVPVTFCTLDLEVHGQDNLAQDLMAGM
jgi:hypothetical protein